MILSKNTIRDLILPAALIVLVTALLYAHTLQVPFYLDDVPALVDNPRLRDLGAAFRDIFGQRGLTNLTFALNYRLTGWELAPLHAVNIVLHAGCGLLAWQLLRRLLGNSRWLPLLGALLLVAHPLQTQGVTYLVQRATTLGTFLFLLAFLLYLRARDQLAAGLAFSSPTVLRPYLGALLAGACAVLAKENTVTLPLLLLAYDRLFPLPAAANRRPNRLTALPFFAVPLAVAAAVLLGPLLQGEVQVRGQDLHAFRWDDALRYLFTQFTVIWVYLRMLLIPCGQALIHNYPLADTLLSGWILLGLGGLLTLAGLGWHLRRRRPLVALGIAWFFLGLAVESSLIPLDPLFEHRLHLPMFGFLLVVLDGMAALVGEKKTVLLGAVALLLCLPLTWQRNALWHEPIAFYRENLRILQENGRIPTAEAPGGSDLRYDLGLALAKAGRLDEATEKFREVLAANPGHQDARVSLGIALALNHRHDEALVAYETVLRDNPGHFLAHYHRGNSLLQTERTAEAIAAYARAVELNPESADARSRLNFAMGIMRATGTP